MCRVFAEPLEARTLLTLAGDSLFPSDNPWNHKITAAPVAANSATLVSSIGASAHLHPDFGGALWDGGLIGIPYNVVSGTQAKVNVIIDAYADESDVRPVPIPSNALIEGDPLPADQNTGDRHLLVYDKDHNLLYELFNTHRPAETTDHQWHADSEAVWDLSQNWTRPAGWTSADAAGLPILPGLVRADEVIGQGAIDHALRFTVPRSASAYVFPASHFAGSNNSALPRMGERFRLKSSFDISGFPPADRVILRALKDYGMIVADNGSAWYLSGAPSDQWNDDDLHDLTSLIGSNFEAVDLTPAVLSLDASSAPSSGGGTLTIHGQNFTGVSDQIQVKFGTLTAGTLTVLDDSTLKVPIPAHAAGTVHVTITTPYGTSKTSASDQFTFTAQNPSLAGTSGDDTFVVALDAPTATVHFFHNTPVEGAPTFSLPLSQVQSVSVGGGGGKDTLSIIGLSATLNLASPVTLDLSSDAHMRLPAHLGQPLRLSGLTIADNSSLDVADNDLIISYSGASPELAIEQYAAAGQRGIRGLLFTPSTSIFPRTLAVFDNHDAALGAFDSVPLPDLNQVLVKYTYLGDANADGIVDPTDYAVVDGKQGIGHSWITGDLNSDGKVDPTDYAQIDGNQGAGISTASAPKLASMAAAAAPLPGLAGAASGPELASPISRRFASASIWSWVPRSWQRERRLPWLLLRHFG